LSVAVAVLVLDWAGASAARAEDAGVSVGTEVILKDLTTNLRVENQVVSVHNQFRRYKVEQINGNWVWIVSGQVRGWVLKDEVVRADRAIEFYTDVIERHPRSSSTYNLRGALWYAKKEYDIALADFSEAIQLNPKNFWAHNNRGNVYWLKRDYERALADYNEAIRINPRMAVTYNNRGNVWSAKHDYARACADYEEAIRRDPSFALAHGNDAYLHATCPIPTMRDGKKALEAAQRANEATQWSDPNHLDALAAAHAESGNYEEAVKWQKKAVAALPDHRRDKDRFVGRLKLYETNQPYRELALASARTVSSTPTDSQPTVGVIP
jgi:tetratricopeptide (TPR) repeat protein